jgi:hypothetical protein
MVRVLFLRLGMITEKQAVVLRVCHEMRRDAFHRGEMNPTILRPVIELLFLAVAELARAFPVHSYSITESVPKGENADFLARFGVNVYDLASEKTKEQIYAKLIEGIAFDFSLRETLSHDLEERIDDTVGELAYLNNDSSDRDKLDRSLRDGQFWRERGADVARKAHAQGRVPKDDLDNKNTVCEHP